MKIADEMNCRDKDVAPLDMLVEAQEIIDKLAEKYSMLATNTDVQHIYALIDGATFKLQTIKEKIKTPVFAEETKEGPTPGSDLNEETVKDEPLTASELIKGIFGFLTAD